MPHRVVITMSGDQAGNPDPWAAWPARAEPLASGDPVPQAAHGPQGTAGRGRLWRGGGARAGAGVAQGDGRARRGDQWGGMNPLTTA